MPGHEGYANVTPDFTTFDGASKAIASPNRATRFLAGQAIKRFWAKEQPAAEDYLAPGKITDARQRARWFWLLAKTATVEKTAIMQALTDDDANIRMAAIRASRQSDQVDNLAVVEMLLNDPSPQVRRELAISLRGNDSLRTVSLWTKLAIQHDGEDRWYLEALGIAASDKWDDCFAAWLGEVGDNWDSVAGRDLIWRSRASQTPAYLSKLILKCKTAEQQQRYFRALEFFDDQPRKAALTTILAEIR